MAKDNRRITVGGDASFDKSTMHKTVHNYYSDSPNTEIVSEHLISRLKKDDREFIEGVFSNAFRNLEAHLAQNKDGDFTEQLEDLAAELAEEQPKKSRIKAAWGFLSRNADQIKSLNNGADILGKIGTGLNIILSAL